MNVKRYDINISGYKITVWGEHTNVVAVCLDPNEIDEFEYRIRNSAKICGPGHLEDTIYRGLTKYGQEGKILPLLKPQPLWGTPFQRKVWAELYKLPIGQLITYGELAQKVGNPHGARAVGAAVGANPITIIVPCHRVVAKNGPGGFGGNLKMKAALLAIEGLQLP